ncbi:methyltransferase [soil metagenome]
MKVCTDACVLGAWTAMKAEQLSMNTILDIGTGTGLLCLMLAQKTTASIDAIEISKDAAEQAKENVEASPWQNRINIHCCSLQEYKTNKRYDLIICNPPFYENDLRSTDANKNAAKHDTSLRLEELLRGVSNNLSDEGFATVLIPFHRTAYFEEAASRQSFFIWEKLLLKQTPAHDPFRTIVLLSPKKTAMPVSCELVIHDTQRSYTNDFNRLLKAYYLKL